jgi:putative DNA methylase
MAIVPFSLKDAPSFIERAFPAQRVSIETQTERKANAGQTLTALGSYWKGRKPLVLVRACILGSLLPATDHPEKDLEIFELLMAMDDAAFAPRMKKVSIDDVQQYGAELTERILNTDGRWKVRGDEKKDLLGRVLARMPYSMRLDKRSLRPEECPDSIYIGIWDRVNAHLRTSAHSHAELVEQLGTMRFGQRPRVADTFAGGGSIPFEAARLGCDVYASDLNPVACMLTWGALNIVGASNAHRAELAEVQQKVIADVETEIARLGIENDREGNRAKAYLYCLEARCPQTGWMVPLAGSWVVSRNKRCVAILEPNKKTNGFDIRIVNDATPKQIDEAAVGTVRDGDMVYSLDGREFRTPIKTLRGDRKEGRIYLNNLRRWEISDFLPRKDDLLQERLYCIQWFRKDTDDFFFAGVSDDDLKRENIVVQNVRSHLEEWQARGLIPDMPLQAGEKTDEPIRTRGWTYWHHLFTPRNLFYDAKYKEAVLKRGSTPLATAALMFDVSMMADRSARLSRWHVGYPGREGVAPSADSVEQVFYNQALNVLVNYANKGFTLLRQTLEDNEVKSFPHPAGVNHQVSSHPAAGLGANADIFITDPPYADAVAYEEISEFFIAWQRKNPPKPFADWTWDSRRDLAIKGSGDDFRKEMVRAYAAMTTHMPDNGLQIVMFTHKDGSVWADMANIFWGAGLKVTAAWYIATETASELKKGGYVQGTVILVLRKRMGSEKTYTNEVVEEVRREVAHQIETLTGLNQTTRAGRDENLFNDADLQMAGFAAALRVLTSYTHIDDQDMTQEALRPRVTGEKTLADRIIEHAVQIANEFLVPEGLDTKIWDRLNGSERFYLRMLDVEETGAKKLDSYQNFGKAFKVRDIGPLMASQKPNDARLKSAMELKKSEFSGSEFGSSTLRSVLFAVYELQSEIEAEEVMSHLRDTVADYMRKREVIVALASYIDDKLAKARPDEAGAARVLAALVKNEKVGG